MNIPGSWVVVQGLSLTVHLFSFHRTTFELAFLCVTALVAKELEVCNRHLKWPIIDILMFI